MADVQVVFKGDSHDLHRAATQAESDLNRVEKATPHVDMDRATRSMRSFQGATRQAHLSIGRLAAAGTGLVAGWGLTRMMTGAASAGIRYNATIESQTIAFRNLLGSQKEATALLKDLTRTAAATPFELPQLASGMQRLLAFKFSVKDAKETLLAAGDAAAAMGGSPEVIERVANALGQMRVKGKVSAEELMQLAEANINAYGYLRKEFNLSAKDFDNLGAAQKKHGFTTEQAIRAIVKGMRQDFKGAMGDQSKSFNGLMSTLQDNFNATMGAITRGLFDEVKKWLPIINKAAGDIQKIWEDKRLSPAEKLKASWEEIKRTGLPAAARKALLDGFAYVGSHAPMALINAFMDAPAWGKIAIGGVLLSKFGPGLKALGGGLSRILGGGIAGGLGGAAASRAAPIPVFVTNMAPGMGGGGLGGIAGRAGGAGASLGFGGLGGFGGPLAIGAGAIIGGIALDKLASAGKLGPLNALFPSDADVERDRIRLENKVISAWRKAHGDVQDFAARQKPIGFLPPELQQEQRQGIARLANQTVDAFQDTLKGRGPTIAKTAEGFAQNAVKGLSRLKGEARTIAEDSIVQMAISLERSGRLPRGSVKRIVDDMKAKLGELPAATQHAVDLFGRQTARIPPLVKAARDALQSLSQPFADSTSFELKVTPIVPSKLRGTRPPAWGGITPGVYGGRDTMMTPIAPGEAILTPQQQALVEGGMPIRQAISATGGDIHGRWMGFAKGGGVDLSGAIAFGRAQLHDRYVMGGGHAYGDFSAWDCSGLASNIAARVDGYTGGFGDTDSLYRSSSRPKGGEPVLWGFAHPNVIQNGVRKQWGHMFIKVGGQVFNAHSPGLGIDQNPSPGALWMVPPGLEGLKGGDSGDGLTSGQADRQERVRTLQNQRATAKAISKSLGRIGTATEAPTGLPDAATRTISAVGRSAAKRALAQGATPEQALEAKDDAERRASIDWYQGELVKARTRKREVKRRISAGLGEQRRLAKTMPRKGQARTRQQQQLQAVRTRLKALRTELSGLNAWIAEIQSELFDLDIAERQDALDDQAAIEAPADTTQETRTDTGPTADQQKAIDDANAEAEKQRAAAEAATQRAATGEAFIRTLFGPGDIGEGGANARAAAGFGGFTINFNSLAPASPQQAQQIADATVGALGGQAFVVSPVIGIGP